MIRIFQRLLTERGLPQVLRGNCAFLTRKLWGIYSEPGFGHHGQFTTMREAIRGDIVPTAARERARRWGALG